jgi:hypothetical protein
VTIYQTVACRFGDAAAKLALASQPRIILDIGGEGRHPEAWNLNPLDKRSLAPHRGEAICRLIRARGENIPLATSSVDLVIVERTPLRPATLREIRRIVKPGAFILLRHADLPWLDPHRNALRMLPGRVHRGKLQIGGQQYRETAIRLDAPAE